MESTDQQSFDARKASYLTEHTGTSMLLLFAIWSMLVVYSYRWNDENLYDEKIVLATAQARSLWNKDQSFRQWANRHGGVYVPPDERTPPNPALAQLPNRDVVTTDGMRLTLMNPAYMMRQMTQEFEAEYGIKGKITGLRYLNPVNAPDDWERSILERYHAGDAGEVVEEATIDQAPYLRYMRPMYMQPGCDKCHAAMGYKTGDLRGGVSVSVPLQPYFNVAAQSSRAVLATHVGVWLIGSLGLAVFAWHAMSKRRERNRLLAQLEHNSLYDGLTGLPTRLLVEDRIAQASAVAQRSPLRQYAVCFVDLDRFKQINDAYGHTAGDHLLCRVSEMLRETVRPGDTVARLGGDEYVVLLNPVRDVDEALDIAERIRRVVIEPVQIDGHEVRIGASIGVALSGRNARPGDNIIHNADIAMYRAKHGGRGGIEVFREGMRAAARDMTELESDLQHALSGNQLLLYFQPIVDLDAGRINGFEALLRWQHPQRGLLSPDRFIPIAERTGEIREIGAWVVRQACAQVHQWQQRYGRTDAPLRIAVNLSAHQLLDDRLVTAVEQAVNEHDMQPGQLALEITETALIREPEHARRQLERLRGLGCRLSADDFGTGYSSLTYLQQYRFDTLKIDRQFVQDASAGGAGMKLCNALIGLGDDLAMQVVAEGVETHDQYLRLLRMGCRRMQGYFFARPLPAAAVEALFEHGEHEDLERLSANQAA